MDALHFKIDQLKSLWQEYRVVNEYSGKDYSDQGEWAREKLQVSKRGRCPIFVGFHQVPCTYFFKPFYQGILTEFDKLIQEQILWKSTLTAEIEDVLVSKIYLSLTFQSIFFP